MYISGWLILIIIVILYLLLKSIYINGIAVGSAASDHINRNNEKKVKCYYERQMEDIRKKRTAEELAIRNPTDELSKKKIEQEWAWEDVEWAREEWEQAKEVKKKNKKTEDKENNIKVYYNPIDFGDKSQEDK